MKSASSAGKGTSLATQKAMQLLEDPDAVMKDKIVNGEVSFDDASPFELLYHLFPYGSWYARAASKFFVGEIPACVTELVTFAHGEMSFRSPSGGVNLHSAYLKLSKLITKCEAQRAAYNVGEVFLATCLKLELVGEGFSTQHDALLDWMLHARLPYRQGAPVPLQVFKDLLNTVYLHNTYTLGCAGT